MARFDKTENSLAAGQRVFGRYYLTRTLGEGGMGVVWLAHDRVLEQPIALKFLAPHLVEDPHEVERLKTETRRSLKLAHPNIVRIHDFIQTPQGAHRRQDNFGGSRNNS
jgi:eukaryotic-like serine/threonine-protein kinase